VTAVADLKLRAAIARFAGVGAALEAASSEANVLAWLASKAARSAAQAKRRTRTATARRLELLDWLGVIAGGRDPGACQRFEVGGGRRALKATRGLAAAAARLTGESVDSFRDAQRERRRLGTRVRQD
jgi:hypothetical protein